MTAPRWVVQQVQVDGDEAGAGRRARRAARSLQSTPATPPEDDTAGADEASAPEPESTPTKHLTWIHEIEHSAKVATSPLPGCMFMSETVKDLGRAAAFPEETQARVASKANQTIASLKSEALALMAQDLVMRKAKSP
eukprot:1410368-Rhodomonas_salina.1